MGPATGVDMNIKRIIDVNSKVFFIFRRKKNPISPFFLFCFVLIRCNKKRFECDLRICDFGLAREEDNFMTDYVVMRWYR